LLLLLSRLKTCLLLKSVAKITTSTKTKRFLEIYFWTLTKKKNPIPPNQGGMGRNIKPAAG